MEVGLVVVVTMLVVYRLRRQADAVFHFSSPWPSCLCCSALVSEGTSFERLVPVLVVVVVVVLQSGASVVGRVDLRHPHRLCEVVVSWAFHCASVLNDSMLVRHRWVDKNRISLRRPATSSCFFCCSNSSCKCC